MKYYEYEIPTSSKENISYLLMKVRYGFSGGEGGFEPRAGHPTYALSRGALRPLGYFSILLAWREGRIRTPAPSVSLVFKTGSNHSTPLLIESIQ